MIAGDIIHGMPHYITRIKYNKHRWFKLVLRAMIFGYTPQISGEQGSNQTCPSVGWFRTRFSEFMIMK